MDLSSHSVPYTTCQLVENEARRVVDLSPLGFAEIPVLGMNRTSSATEGSVFHRHRRCMEITLCVRGSAKFDCNGTVYTITPGMVFVSLPEDAHRLRMYQRGARLYWLFFRMPRRGETAFGLSPRETAFLIGELRKLPRKAFPVTSGLTMAFPEMFANYDISATNPAQGGFMLRATLMRLFSELIRSVRINSDDGKDRRFAAIIDRMRRCPENDYDMKWLMHETRLSANTILARFRTITGLPPHAFLMKCRIRRAKELLAKGDDDVTRIAADLNFSSSQHLATRFRQETGMTPMAWRSACANKETYDNE